MSHSQIVIDLKTAAIVMVTVRICIVLRRMLRAMSIQFLSTTKFATARKGAASFSIPDFLVFIRIAAPRLDRGGPGDRRGTARSRCRWPKKQADRQLPSRRGK